MVLSATFTLGHFVSSVTTIVKISRLKAEIKSIFDLNTLFNNNSIEKRFVFRYFVNDTFTKSSYCGQRLEVPS